MSDRPLPGRSLVSRRAVVDIVHSAVVTSYGVIGVDARLLDRLLGRLGVGRPGIRVRLDRGIEVDLHLTVGYGLPIAEVARQVDSAVRYTIHRSLGHDVHRLTVHVAGLRYQPASVPPSREAAHEASPAEVETGSSDAAEHEPATTEPEAAHETGRGADGRNGRGAARPRRRRVTTVRPDDA